MSSTKEQPAPEETARRPVAHRDRGRYRRPAGDGLPHPDQPRQSCTSSGGLMGPSEFTCSGTAETVKGEGPLTFAGEDDSDPGYRMDLTLSVENGAMDVFASTVGGSQEGGEVSPQNTVRIQAVVPSSDEDVSVNLGVKSGEDADVGGLGYEASFREAE